MWVLIPATVVFVAVAVLLLYFGPEFVLRRWLPGKAAPDDVQRALLPATQSVLFVLGGFIAVIGVVVGLSRHRQELAANARDRARFEFDRQKENARASESALLLRTETERKLRERFVDAVELLADGQSAIKRTAGLYAIASLGDDWAAIDQLGERQVCIDVLCAYLRSVEASGPLAVEEIGVRTTGFALIRSHLSGDRAPWRGCRFDLTGAWIEYEVDLSDVDLGARTVLDFTGANFRGRGRLSLRRASGDGQIILEGVVFAVDLAFKNALQPTVDLRAVVFDGAAIDFNGLRLFGQASLDFEDAELRWTRVFADGVRLNESARFEFRPSTMACGFLAMSDLRPVDQSTVTFDTTRYSEEVSISLSGVMADGAAVRIGAARGIRIEPEPKSEITLASGARFSVRTFVLRDASRVEIHGVTVEAGAEFDAQAAQRQGGNRVSIVGVEGAGVIRLD